MTTKIDPTATQATIERMTAPVTEQGTAAPILIPNAMLRKEIEEARDDRRQEEIVGKTATREPLGLD